MRVGLDSKDALKLLLSPDRDGCAWDMRGKDSSSVHLTLELWVDAGPTPTEVILYDNGTWSLATEVKI